MRVVPDMSRNRALWFPEPAVRVVPPPFRGEPSPAGGSHASNQKQESCMFDWLIWLHVVVVLDGVR